MYVAILLIITGFIVFVISFVFTMIAAYFENKEESSHRQYLSEQVGYKVLSLKEWCEENKIDYDLYGDDSIVKRNYRNYITRIESKVISDSARGK